jgi:hypothetical protein
MAWPSHQQDCLLYLNISLKFLFLRHNMGLEYSKFLLSWATVVFNSDSITQDFKFIPTLSLLTTNVQLCPQHRIKNNHNIKPTQCKWIDPPSMPHTFPIFSPFFYKGQFHTNHDCNRNPKYICIGIRQWAWFSLGIPIFIDLAPLQCTKNQHTHSSISSPSIRNHTNNLSNSWRLFITSLCL